MVTERVKWISIVLLITILCSSIVLAKENDCLYYFYGTGCDECEKSDLFLQNLEDKYPDVQVKKFDVYADREGRELLDSLFTNYKINKDAQGIPAVFLPGSYFVGESSIRSLLEERIKDNTNPNCPSLETQTVIGVVGEKEPTNVLETFTFWRMSGDALQDSLRPAYVGMVLVLLMLFLGIPHHEKVLRRGLLFVIGVFVSYLVYGVGFLAWWGTSKISIIPYKIIAIIALAVIILLLTKMFAKHSAMDKAAVKRVWQKLTSPVIIVIMGIVSGLFSFAAMNIPFLLLRNLIGQASTRWIALPLLAYYIIVMLVPIIIITFIFSKARRNIEQKIEEKGNSEKKKVAWERYYHTIMYSVTGLVLLVGSLYLLFS